MTMYFHITIKEKIMTNKLLKIISAAAVLLLVGAVAFNVGASYGINQGKTIVVEGVQNTSSVGESADFGLFWEVWDDIKNLHFKGKDVPNNELIYGAIDGLTQSLDDPYTIFMKPSDAKKFNEDISGAFSGIGAEIGIRESKLLIISPLKNSPAERAGLKSGDYIVAIDETSSSGLSLDEAVKLIRGELGTNVNLLILRDGFSEPKDFKITRENISVPTLDWEIKDGSIMYVQLYSFNQNADIAFYNAMTSALRRGIRGIVLDLRNNPGGYLEVSVDMAGWFLDRGKLVVAEESRTGARQEFYARGNEALKKIPTVVLVNEGSASASEILAGALRDQRGIKLVGEKTFGKGTVQQLKELSDGSLLKLTVAHWLLPGGLTIEGNGLEPDYKIKAEDQNEESDPQYDKAVDVLKGDIASSRTIFLLNE